MLVWVLWWRVNIYVVLTWMAPSLKMLEHVINPRGAAMEKTWTKTLFIKGLSLPLLLLVKQPGKCNCRKIWTFFTKMHLLLWYCGCLVSFVLFRASGKNTLFLMLDKHHPTYYLHLLIRWRFHMKWKAETWAKSMSWPAWQQRCAFASWAVNCVLFRYTTGRRSQQSSIRASLCRLAPWSLSRIQNPQWCRWVNWFSALWRTIRLEYREEKDESCKILFQFTDFKGCVNPFKMGFVVYLCL